MSKRQQSTQRRASSLLSAGLAWMGPIALTIAVGVAYFFAAQLSLILLTKPDGVAVFWPAAGISSGTLIALGPRARLPVTVGVLAASSLASILGDRSLAAATVFALCNAGEALLVAWLIKHHFGDDFRLQSVRSVLGFFVAAGIGPVISATIATVGFTLFYYSAAPVLTTWLNWFASDAIGIIMVAPLLIGLAGLRADFPKKWELAEGTLTLAMLVILSAIAFGSPAHHWYTALPLGALLLVLLAAHCRPVFAAAAALILAIAVVLTTTFGIDHLGDFSSLQDRAYAARSTLLAISICTLLLAALFAERRHKEVALKDSHDRLQLALDGAELGVWSIDAKSGRFESDARDRKIHGYPPQALPQRVTEARDFIHPDDLPQLDVAFEASKRAGNNCRVEYRLAPTACGLGRGQERWVSVEGTVVRNAEGQPVRLLGVTRDITEYKRATERLQDSERALRELLGALPTAIYVTDAVGRITYYNTAAVALWGAAPELGKSQFCGSWKLYWPDGTPLPLDECPMAMALKQKRSIRGAEAIAERPDGTRVPFIPFPTPLFDSSGTMTGAVNMLVDISDRKRAEQALAERDAQLALAGKIALVGSFTFDIVSGRMQVSPGYAAIHGLPEKTLETSRREWRVRVHSDDLGQLDAHLEQNIAERRTDHHCEYRIVRGGEIRWIEARSSISYDSQGTAQQIVGSNIDVTNRKQTEAELKGSKARLADALAAGQVMAFEWDATTGQSRRSDNAHLILGDHVGELASGREFLRRVHQDDRVCFKAHVGKIRPGNPGYVLTFRFCDWDGREVWLEETARGEFDATGKLLRITGLTRDITERKKAELTLAERSMQLALAGKAALVGSFAYDLDTETLQISAGYAAIHGFPDGITEIKRSDWQAGVHPEDRARVEEVRSRAFRHRRDEYSVDYRVVRSGGEVRWIGSRSFVSYHSDGHPQRVVGINIDATDRKRAEEHQRTLHAELDHRVKNVLATVSAIIMQTPKADSSLADFVSALDDRIKSLGRTHELLSYNRWHGVSLEEIARRELAPYTADNAAIGGPRVTLKADAAQAVAMVLHELATNAAKYGAFSKRGGRLSLRWRWLRNGSSGRLAIDWQELGGPPVQVPSQSGYGTSIVRELIPFELRGTAHLDFAPDGLRCRLEIPADWVRRAGPASTDSQGVDAAQIDARDL